MKHIFFWEKFEKFSQTLKRGGKSEIGEEENASLAKGDGRPCR